MAKPSSPALQQLPDTVAPRWFEPHDGRSRALDPLRLLCFPYAGGGSGCFRDLRFPRVTSYTVMLPGREVRHQESRFRSARRAAEGIGAAILEGIRPPYVFFGHSLGALLAYEVTRWLCARGGTLPEVLIVSGRAAPQLPILTRLYELDDLELGKVVRGYGGTPECMLSDEFFARVMLPIIRDDFEMAENYAHEHHEPLPVPIQALAGDADPVAPVWKVEQWAAITRLEFGIRVFPGSHFFFRSAWESVLQHLHDILALAVRGVEPPFLPPEEDPWR